MLPFTSLAAVTADANGTSKDLEATSGLHTMLVTVTGSPSSGQIILEGSHDGSTWFGFGSSSNPIYPTVTANVALRYVRARLFGLGGGASPTVTATIASAE